MSRMDIMQPRQGSDGKTYWTKLGSAWPAKNGPGFSLTFEALPLQSLKKDDRTGEMTLECRVLLREPLPPRDGQPAQRSNAGPPPVDDLNDDVPF